ncbi:type II toxin-antitoxin system RelE/ParE family toxin [Candidatus Acetothermia bacterium]|nr:type II toxin-antitoxin system RelE/ParE family toxin [Candidatus Acetothermia bacterium]
MSRTRIPGLIPVNHRAKVRQRVGMLAELGPTLPFPYSSQVEGGLRELRAKYGHAQYRVLYYGDRNRAFVLLHAFLKKTEESPEQERILALQRLRADQQNKGA